MKSIMKFLKDERGAQSIEYAGVVSAAGIATYGSVKFLSDTTRGKFEEITVSLDSVETTTNAGSGGGG